MLIRHFVLIFALAFVIRQRYVIKPAQESLALGLMIDESVNVSKSENMVLYLRFLFLGVFVTRFWRIVKCEKVDAKSLAEKVKMTFEEDAIPTTRLRCLGTDGASVMTGSNGGVAVLLRLCLCAFLLAIHCIGGIYNHLLDPPADVVPEPFKVLGVVLEVLNRSQRCGETVGCGAEVHGRQRCEIRAGAGAELDKPGAGSIT